MARNTLSPTRRCFVKPAKIAEQYDISRAQIYRLLAMPIFAEAIIKAGEKSIRVDQDKFAEIREQYFG